MQIGIMTENKHSKARIVDIKTDKLRQNLKEGKIIVIAGFQEELRWRDYNTRPAVGLILQLLHWLQH